MAILYPAYMYSILYVNTWLDCHNNIIMIILMTTDRTCQKPQKGGCGENEVAIFPLKFLLNDVKNVHV